ncbi:hypothetical protein [Rhizobium sp. FKY42]|uniref:hypothetical protein n=1 Tax=Rhizobium sp. FKY42 TaxID=2562310 RepID=UPI0010BFE643|nr:hypothetical protein [Rhizobium sp. FKY42]
MDSNPPSQFVELQLVPRNRLKTADRIRLKKWESWLVKTLTSIHQMGAIGLPPPTNLLEKTRNVLQALHDGAESWTELEELGRLEPAPEFPSVWPDDFPVRAALAAMAYLEEVREVRKISLAARTE